MAGSQILGTTTKPMLTEALAVEYRAIGRSSPRYGGALHLTADPARIKDPRGHAEGSGAGDTVKDRTKTLTEIQGLRGNSEDSLVGGQIRDP
ncbi:hypothetical protein GUJ93_ZPchr0002g23636 [Zizania palustris]|uniref:Uncharacterized protein n=1 Tax=Zizania palustris TaxID=103762 RepID=A0A8J5S5Z5_ZIZPA|nr:hypothetical protein GUJ93_ZPchr0002g23636 [Zizania palustris]